MNKINSDEIFNQKLTSYSKKLKKPDPALPIYRRFRVRPLILWPMWKLTLFIFVFFQLSMSFVFTAIALVIRFSLDRCLLFFEYFVEPQFILMGISFALLFAPWMKFCFKRSSGIRNWEEL